MLFHAVDGIKLLRDRNRLVQLDKPFWKYVERKKPGLCAACGCYTFAIKHGDKITPWYVGRAEKQSFKAECSTAHKMLKFYHVSQKNGTPMLYFLARMTLRRETFAKPSKNGRADVRALEIMLISMALGQNPKLLNKKGTRFLRQITIPGVYHADQGKPSAVQSEMRKMLGLAKR